MVLGGILHTLAEVMGLCCCNSGSSMEEGRSMQGTKAGSSHRACPAAVAEAEAPECRLGSHRELQGRGYPSVLHIPGEAMIARPS